MKTIGKWIAFVPLVEESKSGIKNESLDKGTVCYHCNGITNGLQIGDKIHFDINKVASKSADYWIICVDDIYGVLE